jgi:hypothetical protein
VALTAISVPGARAHPGSGIVVDQQGQVFFAHSGVGVAKIDAAGALTYIHRSRGGHWLCLDEKGSFSRTQPKYFRRITGDGIKPALIFADGGAPLAVNRDGALYYASGEDDDRPGGLALTREQPGGGRTGFAPALTEALRRIDDGVTGLAGGPDGSLYVACWTPVFKVKPSGAVVTLAGPIKVKDCDEDKADHQASNRLRLLRGLAARSESLGFVAVHAHEPQARLSMQPRGDGVAEPIDAAGP